MPFESAAYYLFSSILQADAAMIGIGIIFVIFRLQDLQSRSQAALQLLQTQDHFSSFTSGLVRTILENKSIESVGSALKEYQKYPYYSQLELLFTSPLRAMIVRSYAIRTMWFLCIQMFLLACCISTIPLWQATFGSSALFVMCGFVILYFGWALIRTISTVKSVFPTSTDLELKILCPEVEASLHA